MTTDGALAGAGQPGSSLALGRRPKARWAWPRSALARMGPMVAARPGQAAPNRASHVRTCRRRMAVVPRAGRGEATACCTREASVGARGIGTERRLDEQGPGRPVNEEHAIVHGGLPGTYRNRERGKRTRSTGDGVENDETYLVVVVVDAGTRLFGRKSSLEVRRKPSYAELRRPIYGATSGGSKKRSYF